ncbi:MAG: EAL domain-containing protein [Spirochaetales bacterium]|nr:EAL domain-containing protein [Spirochaetales bacterium]
MPVITFLVSVFFTFTLFLAGYIYFKNPRGKANRLFVLFSLPTAVWRLGFIFMTNAADETVARGWFRFMVSGWYLFVPLLLHLILILAGYNPAGRRRWLLLLMYLPALPFTCAYTTALTPISGFERTNLGWVYVYNPDSLWLDIGAAFVMIYVLTGLAQLVRSYLRTPRLIQKRQSRVLIITMFFSFLMNMFTTFAPLFGRIYFLPHLEITISAIWELGVSYAILRYGLMLVSPASAASSILSTMADGLLLTDVDGKIIGGNRALSEILEIEEKAVVGRPVRELLPATSAEHDLLKRLSKETAVRDMETVFAASGGREISLSLAASPVTDKIGQKAGYVVLLRDISERKRTEKQLQHLATHDMLTNLPNRTVLNDRLRNALARAKRHGQQVGIMLVDVDHFKEVNDLFGHDCGDMFLRGIADRLLSGVRDYDTVARMGGDEFAVVLPDLPGSDDCLTVIKRIRESLSRPLTVGKRQITAGVSMGVSFYPLHAENVEDLFKYADLALYRVKASGRGNYLFYSPEIDAAARKHIKLEQELLEAIGGNQFELHYQPIYDTDTRKLMSLEALIRWNHPEFGLISPMSFIPLAERSGAIIPLGNWVLESICRQQKIWEGRGFSPVPVTVNISARQFQDQTLLEKIIGLLRDHRLEPRLLELELTESTAMIEIERTINTVRRLKEIGIAIIIDDFGSGYSSMAWLKQLSVRAIKIDRFFIQNIAHDPHDAAIVKAIVSMAHSMGIRVVAEGVETEEQLASLRSMRWEVSTELMCDSVQGYLFSKPLTSADVAGLLEREAR